MALLANIYMLEEAGSVPNQMYIVGGVVAVIAIVYIAVAYIFFLKNKEPVYLCWSLFLGKHCIQRMKILVFCTHNLEPVFCCFSIL